MEQLKAIDGLGNVRGKGLMIGFDVPESNPTLRKNLLQNHKIFTGEAKPNVIRLLPALNIGNNEASALITAIKKEVG